jgi:hypothetical protein
MRKMDDTKTGSIFCVDAAIHPVSQHIDAVDALLRNAP